MHKDHVHSKSVKALADPSDLEFDAELQGDAQLAARRSSKLV